MATYSIGATARNYATVTAWEAATGAGDIGEMYDDSAFDELVTINGGQSELRAATGEGHDGTAGSGARFVKTGGDPRCIVLSSGTVSHLDLDGGSGGGASGKTYVAIFLASSTTFRRCLIHNLNNTSLASFGVTCGNYTVDLLDCVIYDIQTTTGAVTGFSYAALSRSLNAYNLTVHDIAASSGGTAYCVTIDDDSANKKYRNIIATDPSSSGTAACFDVSSPGTAVVDHNLSSDATASGTGSLTSKASADQFVSTVGGSEDLHLKAGADAIDEGADLGTSPSGVEIDIDGRDRDAEGDTWDIGAHEYVASGPSVALLRRRGRA